MQEVQTLLLSLWFTNHYINNRCTLWLVINHITSFKVLRTDHCRAIVIQFLHRQKSMFCVASYPQDILQKSIIKKTEINNQKRKLTPPQKKWSKVTKNKTESETLIEHKWNYRKNSWAWKYWYFFHLQGTRCVCPQRNLLIALTKVVVRERLRCLRESNPGRKTF